MGYPRRTEVPMSHPKTDAVIETAMSRLDDTITRLGEYLAYPAIS